MARVITSPETDAINSEERFGNSSQGWLGLFLAGSFACMLALAIFVRIATRSPMFSASPIIDIVILCGLCSLLIVPLTVVSIQYLIAEIRVDKDTLTWKTWQGTHSVLWSDVQDFYEYQGYVVKTSDGDCRFLPAWSRSSFLKRLIAERATSARTRQWNMLGNRPEIDWPKTLGCDSASRWGIGVVRLGCYGCIISAICYFGLSGWRSAKEIAASSGWGLALAFLAVEAFVFFIPFLVFLPGLPSFGELHRLRSQTITLSQDGICYRDNAHSIEARWDEITSLTYNRPGPYVVETKHGTFDFQITMRECRAVFRAIKAMTAATLPDGWQSKTPERLDRPTRQDSRFTSGQDAHVFSYRTRTNRAFVLLGVMFFGLQGGFALWKHPLSFHGLSLADLIVAGIIVLTLAGGLGFTLWGWLTYLTESIQTDEAGLTRSTWFGSKRIRWSEVTGMKIVGGGAFTWIVISSARQKIWLSPLIADCKKLIAEIKTRGPEGCAFSAEDAERLARLVGQD